MLIDLSKLLTHEGKQQQVEILPSGDTFSCELGEFSYGCLLYTSDAADE